MKTELQQLLKARFAHLVAPSPQVSTITGEPSGSTKHASDGTAPDGPRALVAAPSPAHPGQPENTTHREAIGQSIATARSVLPRRVLGIAAVVTVAAAAITVALVARHGDSDSADVEPARRAEAGALRIPPQDSTQSRSPRVAPASHDVPAPVVPPAVTSHSSTLIVVTEPSDAMVRIEDATTLIAAARSPLTIPVTQGARLRITAELSGHASVSQTLTVDEQDRHTVTLTLAPVARAASTTPRRESPTTRKPSSRAPHRPAKPKEPDYIDEIIK
jgi:hypothetical protein